MIRRPLAPALLALALATLATASASADVLLFDSGPLATSLATGAGGADESVLQDVGLGMQSFGFLAAAPLARVADDFTVTDPQGWVVTRVVVFGYQTGSGTTSSLTGATLRILSGPPSGPVSLLFGDTATDRLAATGFANLYRVAESEGSGGATRPVMTATIDVTPPVLLPPGTYWLDWQLAGNALLAGPFVPPVTVAGSSGSGNALRTTDGGGTWVPVVDTGTATPQTLPFQVIGRIGQPTVEVPALGAPGLALLAVALAGAALVGLARRGA